MDDFRAGLARQDALRAAADSQAAVAGSTERARAEEVAKTLNQGWIDLAGYLSERGVRTFEYRHYAVNWKWKLLSKYLPPSPPGFVIKAENGNGTFATYGQKKYRVPRKAWTNLARLELLLPDGRRWSHHVHMGDARQGFQEITAEAALANSGLGDGIYIGEGALYKHWGYGEKEPVIDYLANLAQKMRDPNHYSDLWT